MLLSLTFSAVHCYRKCSCCVLTTKDCCTVTTHLRFESSATLSVYREDVFKLIDLTDRDKRSPKTAMKWLIPPGSAARYDALRCAAVRCNGGVGPNRYFGSGHFQAPSHNLHVLSETTAGSARSAEFLSVGLAARGGSTVAVAYCHDTAASRNPGRQWNRNDTTCERCGNARSGQARYLCAIADRSQGRNNTTICTTVHRVYEQYQVDEEAV